MNQAQVEAHNRILKRPHNVHTELNGPHGPSAAWICNCGDGENCEDETQAVHNGRRHRAIMRVRDGTDENPGLDPENCEVIIDDIPFFVLCGSEVAGGTEYCKPCRLEDEIRRNPFYQRQQRREEQPYEARRGHWWRFGFIIYDFHTWGFQKGVWTVGVNLGRLSIWVRYRKNYPGVPIPYRYR